MCTHKQFSDTPRAHWSPAKIIYKQYSSLSLLLDYFEKFQYQYL